MKFKCPACKTPLEKEQRPKSPMEPILPYWILWCANPRCISDSAKGNGGTGPTEEAAYQSLCIAVDNETEKECVEIISPEERKERMLIEKEERKGDRDR